MIGRFFVYSATDGYYKTIEVGKNPDCPLCGSRPQIRSLGDAKQETTGCGP